MIMPFIKCDAVMRMRCEGDKVATIVWGNVFHLLKAYPKAEMTSIGIT